MLGLAVSCDPDRHGFSDLIIIKFLSEIIQGGHFLSLHRNDDVSENEISSLPPRTDELRVCTIAIQGHAYNKDSINSEALHDSIVGPEKHKSGRITRLWRIISRTVLFATDTGKAKSMPALTPEGLEIAVLFR